MAKSERFFRNSDGKLITKSNVSITKTVGWVLFTIALLFGLLFKSVEVKPNATGLVYSMWNGKSIAYLKPGQHFIFRFYGYTPALTRANAGYYQYGQHIFQINTRPVEALKTELYAKYSYSYLESIMHKINDMHPLQNTGTLQQVQMFLRTDPEINKYLTILSIKEISCGNCKVIHSHLAVSVPAGTNYTKLQTVVNGD